jgi:hypothetical protein
MLSSSESWEPQTAPTSLALACRWRSRPQHQKQKSRRARPVPSFRLRLFVANRCKHIAASRGPVPATLSPPVTQARLPRIAQGARAGVGGGVRGELAVELAEQRNAVGEAIFGAGGGEHGVLRRGGAVDEEARAGKGLECGGKRGIAHPVVRPGEPSAERQHGVGIDRQRAIEARTQLAAGVGAGAPII